MTVLLCLAPSTSTAAPAGFVRGITGAACKPSNLFQSKQFLYDKQALFNTGSDRWDVLQVVCPYSFHEPGYIVSEYRVLFEDSEARYAYCLHYDWKGQELPMQSATWRGSEGMIQAPMPRKPAYVEGAFYCLLHPKASITRVEFVFDRVK